ncbi:L,D-transpeptidase family protein [Pseudomonadota bacterium]|nr:L,D-transpeptidase family protein [Pseudomonadota bacterium]
MINLCQSAQALTQQSFEKSNALDTASLAELYPNTTHFTWLNKQQLTSHGHDAIDFISSSPRHGLSSHKYHLTELKQLDPSADKPTAQRFELLLTDGLLKLISDLKVGKLNAAQADPNWFIPQQKFDAVAFLQQAVLQPHLKNELNALLPNTDEYRTLTQTLALYQRYVDRGGWNTVAKSPLLRVGDNHPNIIVIRNRLAFEDPQLIISATNASTYYDETLEQAVRHFQTKFGLKVDGVIGSDTIKAMNISAQARVQQLKVALERRRWMPNQLGSRYLIINLANYSLSAYENDQETLAMRVIVGRKNRQTPSFTATMNHLVFNPYWNVPKKLARLDLLPKQQQNFNYFYSHDIRVFSRESGKKIEHDPYLIDWESISYRNFPYILRQDPGEHNALGKIKFMFKNQWNIYLHDTSHRALFSQDIRSLSSGCIRVEDPLALAEFSLNTTPKETILALLESNENKGRKVKSVLTIYAVYFTVSVEQNKVRFSPDIYQRDKRMANLL